MFEQLKLMLQGRGSVTDLPKSGAWSGQNNWADAGAGNRTPAHQRNRPVRQSLHDELVAALTAG